MQNILAQWTDGDRRAVRIVQAAVSVSTQAYPSQMSSLAARTLALLLEGRHLMGRGVETGLESHYFPVKDPATGVEIGGEALRAVVCCLATDYGWSVLSGTFNIKTSSGRIVTVVEYWLPLGVIESALGRDEYLEAAYAGLALSANSQHRG
ncbi:hypothetical protein OL229_10740 [Neisseriaceae bacterium JH1-16]|nr:hypothetical protein [Neisseriaceae bacterium JH1-16]